VHPEKEIDCNDASDPVKSAEIVAAPRYWENSSESPKTNGNFVNTARQQRGVISALFMMQVVRSLLVRNLRRDELGVFHIQACGVEVT